MRAVTYGGSKAAATVAVLVDGTAPLPPASVRDMDVDLADVTLATDAGSGAAGGQWAADVQFVFRGDALAVSWEPGADAERYESATYLSCLSAACQLPVSCLSAACQLPVSSP